jgi:hypothetical protein
MVGKGCESCARAAGGEEGSGDGICSKNRAQDAAQST